MGTLNFELSSLILTLCALPYACPPKSNSCRTIGPLPSLMLSIAKTCRRILFNLKSDIWNLKVEWPTFLWMTPATELHKDDEISDQEVFKKKLEESGNSGGLQGGAVGGTFGDQIYFLFFGYKVLVFKKILVGHFFYAIFH